MDCNAWFMEKAKAAVADWLTKDYQKRGETGIVPAESVFCVWNCKTLQNHKGIFAAPTPDQYLFEVTYNGDVHEMYVDCYNKIDKLTLEDE